MNKFALLFTLFIAFAMSACNKDADTTAAPATVEAVAPATEGEAAEGDAAATATEESAAPQEEEKSTTESK